MIVECVEFQGAKDKWGYGRQGHKGKVVYSHRLAYAQANGLDVLTMGGVVMHSCDNPACISPEHLSLGTSALNSKDMVSKARQARGTGRPCKLSEADVIDIRRDFIPRSPGVKSNCQELVAKYRISRSNLDKIVKRHSWKHI